AFDLPARTGIAALLEDADRADLIQEPSAPTYTATTPALSTSSVDFAAILADLSYNTARVAGPVVPVGPEPLSSGGDLVVVIGLADDAARLARSMTSFHGDQALRSAGKLNVPGVGRITDRSMALAARAAGVENGHPIIVAFGLQSPSL